MSRFVGVVIASVFLVLSAGSMAFEGEPEGFGKYRWDIPIRDAEGFSLKRAEEGGVEIYVRLGEHPVFEGLSVDALEYKFLFGRFAAVDIMVSGRTGFERLKKTCFGKFGEARPGQTGREEYVWIGKHSLVDLRYAEEKEEGWLTMVSTKSVLKDNHMVFAWARRIDPS